jgi:acylphosphatase
MQDPNSASHIETVHVTVSGTVQGVGYRHATHDLSV